MPYIWNIYEYAFKREIKKNEILTSFRNIKRMLANRKPRTKLTSLNTKLRAFENITYYKLQTTYYTSNTIKYIRIYI